MLAQITNASKVKVVRSLAKDPSDFKVEVKEWFENGDGKLTKITTKDNNDKVLEEKFLCDGVEVKKEETKSFIDHVLKTKQTKEINKITKYIYPEFTLFENLFWINGNEINYTTIRIDDEEKLKAATDYKVIKSNNPEIVARSIYKNIVNIPLDKFEWLTEIYFDKTGGRRAILKEENQHKLKKILNAFKFPKQAGTILVILFNNAGETSALFVANNNYYIFEPNKDNPFRNISEAEYLEYYRNNKFNIHSSVNIKVYKGTTGNKGAFELYEIYLPYPNKRIFKGAFRLNNVASSFDKKLIKKLRKDNINFEIKDTDSIELFYMLLKEALEVK